MYISLLYILHAHGIKLYSDIITLRCVVAFKPDKEYSSYDCSKLRERERKKNIHIPNWMEGGGKFQWKKNSVKQREKLT